MSGVSKEFVKKALEKGEFSVYSQFNSSSAKWWSNFRRIRDGDGKNVPFVQCQRCFSLLAYDQKKTGTSSLSSHAESCRVLQSENNQNIVQMLQRQTPSNVSAEMKRVVTEALAMMCATDIRPFEIAAGSGFTSFCQTLLDIGRKNREYIDSQSLLPDPTTISRRLQLLAEKKREELKDKLTKVSSKLYGVTLDYWTNKFTSDSYVTITIHYENDAAMESFVLKTLRFDQSKTAENTRSIVQETLDSFGIVVSATQLVFVTDNAANLAAALDGEAHIRCVCHCLNLAVQQSIVLVPSVKQMIDNCSSIVTHFKRIGLQSSLDTTLKKDIDTRWNTIVEMLHSIQLNKEKLIQLLHDRNEDHWINSIAFETIDDLCSILMPFKFGSEQLSADKSPTLHLVLPFLKSFKDICAPETNDSTGIAQLKTVLLSKLDEKVWLSELHYVATFLHPSTKSLSSISSEERNQVMDSVRRMFCTLGIDEEVEKEQNRSSIITDRVNSISKRKTKRKNKKRRITLDVSHILQAYDADNHVENDEDDDDEVDEYFKMKLVIDANESILKWWKNRSLVFPRLARLALALLCVPASSASSERVFSETGRILEARRQQLSRDSVDGLVFLRNWFE